MSRKDGSSNNPVKLRDVVSKVVINTKSKASIVKDILEWLKPTIENGNTEIITKEKNNE